MPQQLARFVEREERRRGDGNCIGSHRRGMRGEAHRFRRGLCAGVDGDLETRAGRDDLLGQLLALLGAEHSGFRPWSRQRTRRRRRLADRNRSAHPRRGHRADRHPWSAASAPPRHTPRSGPRCAGLRGVAFTVWSVRVGPPPACRPPLALAEQSLPCALGAGLRAAHRSTHAIKPTRGDSDQAPRRDAELNDRLADAMLPFLTNAAGRAPGR